MSTIKAQFKSNKQAKRATSAFQGVKYLRLGSAIVWASEPTNTTQTANAVSVFGGYTVAPTRTDNSLLLTYIS